jgi:hypothetical protein
MGIFAGQRLRWPRALVAIVIAAAIDVTLGSYLANRIGPGGATAVTRTAEVVGTAGLSLLLNVAFGGAGIAIGARVARRPG